MNIELRTEGQAIAAYLKGRQIGRLTWQPKGRKEVVADHTQVDPAYRGQGIAQVLLDQFAKLMRAQGKRVDPACSYVARQFAQQPEIYADVMAEKDKT